MTSRAVRVREVATPQGTARVHLHRPDSEGAEVGTLLLGHGAGGGVEAGDLQALTVLSERGWTVALLEQPWRVAGRRVAGPPPTLDSATTAVLRALRRGRWRVPEPVVLGGRSAGARVACRLAHEAEAAAVVALAFPLHPPGRPERSRAGELAVPLRHDIPLLVVQGARDPFGRPGEVRTALTTAGGGAGAAVVKVPGDHSPGRDLGRVVEAVRRFLDGLRWGASQPTGDAREEPSRMRSTDA